MDDEVAFAVKSLKAGKLPGPHDTDPEMFISILEHIPHLLNRLFNRVFTQGQFLDVWSKSIIIPIHK